MNRPAGIPAVDPLYADLRRHDPVRPAVILDVREADEFRDVRIPGSLFVPMSQLPARLQDIPKDRPLLVLCAAGSRSQQVTGHLLQNGWEDVGNIAGGITAWERMGLEVRKGPVADGEGTLEG
ncbi:MAG TPA: rhodanese-like domain-containing protein [Candidatus Limnocylindrales bacterium]|jgi:rhodanese-related sulfurtransferase